MKRIVVGLVAATVATGLLVAQSFIGGGPPRSAQPNPPRRPPLLSLPEAFTLAMSQLGAVSNRYYCVAANCMNDLPRIEAGANHGSKGWTFGFSNSDGDRVRIFVFFDKTTGIDAVSGVLQ